MILQRSEEIPILVCIFHEKLKLTSKEFLTWLQNDRQSEPKQNKIICKSTRIVIITQFPFQRKSSCHFIQHILDTRVIYAN